MFLWEKKSIIKRIEEHLFLYLRFLFILTNKKSIKDLLSKAQFKTQYSGCLIDLKK